MITPSFSPTATERVLPKLALDFTTASLDPRITFTRTTSASNPATYVASNGYVTNATNNQPRLDYDPITLKCNGLLIEESRANLFPASEDLSNTTYWTPTNISCTLESVTNPANVASVTKLVVANGIAQSTSGYVFRNTASSGSGVSYSASIFMKAAERTFACIRVTTSQSSITRVYFNLSDGTVASSSNATGIINSFGNGWYRCTILFTTQNTSNIAIRFSGTTGGTSATEGTGDGVSGIYVWGAQLEAGAFSTSYIPTTTTALTRNADVATMTGANFSSWWTSTTGGAVVWLTPKSISTLAYLSFDDNTANNKIVLANSTTSGQTKITSGGVLQATLTAGTITANATNKVSAAWNTNNCAATANATTPATTASATIPTVSQLRIGSDGTAYANAWIQKISYWPQRLINAEVQAFSK